MPEPSNTLLIVGLGNPEPEYAGTRHNLGRTCVAALARRLDADRPRRRWRSTVCAATAGDHKVWMILPETYMNLSGRAVMEAVRDTGVGMGQVWIVHDELDLPLCRLRIRLGGSTAGHNGVASVADHLRSRDFVRFRIGIGRGGGQGGTRHVLGRFSTPERERLEQVVGGVTDALELAIREGVERAMERYNRAGALGCEELP